MKIVGAIITALGTIIAAIISYYAYQKKNIHHKISNRKLKYHPIHQRMNDFREYINYEINIDSNGREKLVKDFLTHLIDIYQSRFKKLAKIVDKKELSNEELKELNLQSLHEAINERSTYFFTDDYTEKERISLDLLVKKYQCKKAKRIQYFKNDIKKVIDSKYYDDQITMQSLIFDKYIGEFSHLMTWFEDVIDDINGDFNGLNFKGHSLNGEKEDEE